MTTTKAFRIWAQGATDQVAHHNYLAALLPHMKACCDPDFELEFKTMTPSVTTVHALSEHRFSREVIRGAIQAERESYDVFFMNHFQDMARGHFIVRRLEHRHGTEVVRAAYQRIGTPIR